MKFFTEPWPWYVAGPIIGLFVPLLLLIGNKGFGISSSFRHLCAACFPGKIDFFKYNWKNESWQLFLALGIIIGGYLGYGILENPPLVNIDQNTKAELIELGIKDFTGFVPSDIFSWASFQGFEGWVFIVLGGFLVGFGTRYAGGCTSGHSITGMSNLQGASLIATISFFAGGLLVTHLIYPFINI